MTFEPRGKPSRNIEWWIDMFFIVVTICAIYPVLKIIDAWEWMEKK